MHGGDPKMTGRIQMKPIPPEVFGLVGIQVDCGKGEKSARFKPLPAGPQKRVWIIQMFNDLPTGDCPKLFISSGLK